jgi:hypothetical protein
VSVFDPDRHNFALFRAGAAILRRIFGTAGEDETHHRIRDRHQSAVETYAVACWIQVTITCYVAGSLFDAWPLPPALLTAALLTPAIVQLPFGLLGVVLLPPLRALAGRRGTNNLVINSFVFMSLVAALSIHFAFAEDWLRIVAWQFLMLTAANGVAATLLAMTKKGGAAFAR